MQETTDRLMLNVPHAIRDIPGWLLWKLQPRKGGGFDKMPYYVTTKGTRNGTQGTPEDRANLVTFKAAMEAFQGGNFDGVGIATLPGFGIVAGDFDAKEGKTLHPEAMELANTTYAEKSPSGKGIRCLWLGSMPTTKKPGGGVEVFGSTGFVTITGNVINDLEPVPLPAHVRVRLEALTGGAEVDAQPAIGGTRMADPKQLAELRSALEALPADEYHQWVNFGNALVELGDAGFSLWDEWSRKSNKYDAAEAMKKWRGFKGGAFQLESIFFLAQEAGWVNTAKGGNAPTIPPEQHPLAQFVEIDTKPRAVDWVIPGLIASGVVTISGARGVGKTTAILPLAMAAAGLHAQGYALAPKPGRWRHVIYVVEDIAQAQRIVAGMVGHSNLGLRMEDVRERLHLVEAKRLDPKIVVEVGELYRAKFTRTVDGVEIPPLVVFDTKSAVLAMESENDNSEASRAVALLKEKFADLPTWVVGHIAKTLTGSQDVDSLSDRGAGAFEADAVQNLYLIKQQGTRILLLGKKRFHSPWRELPVECHSAEVLATDAWGDTEVTLLLWGIVAPTVESRQEASEDAAKEEAAAREAEARKKAMEAVHGAWKLGQPLNRTALKSRIGMKAQEAVGLIDALLCEGHLASVTVPAKERTNPKRSEYLIYLDATERAAYIDTGALPRAKTVPPASWRKGLPAVCDSEIPFVPDDENETGEILQASEVEA